MSASAFDNKPNDVFVRVARTWNNREITVHICINPTGVAIVMPLAEFIEHLAGEVRAGTMPLATRAQVEKALRQAAHSTVEAAKAGTAKVI